MKNRTVIGVICMVLAVAVTFLNHGILCNLSCKNPTAELYHAADMMERHSEKNLSKSNS